MTDRIMVAVELTLPDGEVLERSWTVAEAESSLHPEFVNEALPWVSNTRKSWPHPQDLITFTADVKPGCEREVREWLLSR